MSTDAYQYTTFDSFSPCVGVGPYRAADYWRQEEGAPVELIHGRFVVSPALITLHQIITGELYAILRGAQAARGGLALMSPIDIVLDDQNIVQPDLVYLAKDRLNQVGDRIGGPPSLVIEVLSPGTANRDRQAKLALYARFGAPEYWIVDPAARSFDFLVNDGGRYVVVNPVDDVYRSSVTQEVEIDLKQFWSEVDRRNPQK